MKTSPRIPALLGSLALGAALSTASAQSVLVVDDSGGEPFISIGQALVAASDGDVVLVRSGTYVENVVVDGRSVAIAADGGARVDVRGQVLVRNVPSGGVVTLKGLRVIPTGPFELFVAESSPGRIFVEDCHFEAGWLTPLPANGRCEDAVVTFIDCLFDGGTTIGPIGNPGLWSIRSSVYLFDTDITGGTGYYGPGFNPAHGGAGILQDEGFLYAANGTIVGGQGGTAGTIAFCLGQISGAGGDGLLMLGAAPHAALLNVEMRGGDPGPVLGGGSCFSGTAGLDVVALNGTVTRAPWPVHGMSVESPAVEGSPVEVNVKGLPGELALLMISYGHKTNYFPELVGPLLLSFPVASTYIGALDANGELSYDLPLLALASGAEGDVFYIQPLFLDTFYGFTVTRGAALVVLADE